MKRFFTVLSVLLLCGMCCFAQEASKGLMFDAASRDLGHIRIGQTRTTSFEMTAVSGVVVILSAATNCECTKADYSGKPLRKGDKSSLKVSFEARERGYFRKNIQVKYNADGVGRTRVVTVTGIVE